MNLRLELTNTRNPGRDAGRIFDFDDGPVTVGRSSNNRVVMEGEMISRTHITIDLVHGAWQVTHQGSKTPTLLNGAELPRGQPRRLSDGDSISVDDYKLRVSFGRNSVLPSLEPIHESSADMTIGRNTFMGESDAGQRTVAAGGHETMLPPAVGAQPGPAGRVVPTLIVMGGEQGRLELREIERAYVIGRASGCDLTLANGAVSRKHAIVQFDGARIYARDAAARSPLLVNGRPIVGETPLAHGDVLTVGPVELRVVTEAAESQPAPSSGAATEVLGAARPAPWAAPSPEPRRPADPAPAPEEAPRWDRVARSASGQPDWAAAAPPPPPPSPPPPPPPAAAPRASSSSTGSDWSAMAKPAPAPAAPRAWETPAPPPPPPAPPPAWDLPPAAPPPPPPPPMAAPAAPAWSPPPPVGAPPPPPPPPAPPKFAAAPPPAIPEPSAIAPAPSRAATGLGPAPKVVARRASSHKGWLVAGVVSMLFALTGGTILLVLATSGS